MIVMKNPFLVSPGSKKSSPKYSFFPVDGGDFDKYHSQIKYLVSLKRLGCGPYIKSDDISKNLVYLFCSLRKKKKNFTKYFIV